MEQHRSPLRRTRGAALCDPSDRIPCTACRVVDTLPGHGGTERPGSSRARSARPRSAVDLLRVGRHPYSLGQPRVAGPRRPRDRVSIARAVPSCTASARRPLGRAAHWATATRCLSGYRAGRVGVHCLAINIPKRPLIVAGRCGRATLVPAYSIRRCSEHFSAASIGRRSGRPVCNHGRRLERSKETMNSTKGSRSC